MSEPTESTPESGPGGAPQAGHIPSTGADQPTEEHRPGSPAPGVPPNEGVPTGEGGSRSVPPPPTAPPGTPTAPPGPAGHYVFVPAGATLRAQGRFGPAFGRFARHRATQLVAAVVVGALIGGGTVALVDNADHPGHGRVVSPFFREGGQFDPHRYHVQPNQGLPANPPAQGSQGSGGGQGSGG